MKPLLFIALALSAAISTLPTAAEQSDRSRPERRLNISTVTYEAERQEVKRILATNKSERHLRGGEATRQKYRSIQSLRG